VKWSERTDTKLFTILAIHGGVNHCALLSFLTSGRSGDREAAKIPRRHHAEQIFA
jgi:hypothetical protein